MFCHLRHRACITGGTLEGGEPNLCVSASWPEKEHFYQSVMEGKYNYPVITGELHAIETGSWQDKKCLPRSSDIMHRYKCIRINYFS